VGRSIAIALPLCRGSGDRGLRRVAAASVGQGEFGESGDATLSKCLTMPWHTLWSHRVAQGIAFPWRLYPRPGDSACGRVASPYGTSYGMDEAMQAFSSVNGSFGGPFRRRRLGAAAARLRCGGFGIGARFGFGVSPGFSVGTGL